MSISSGNATAAAAASDRVLCLHRLFFVPYRCHMTPIMYAWTAPTTGWLAMLLLLHIKHCPSHCLTFHVCLQVSYDPDYVCLDCPNHWVAGMGMDTNQRFRSLDYVAVLKPEAIQRALHA
jgi:hypothetical protein